LKYTGCVQQLKRSNNVHKYELGFCYTLKGYDPSAAHSFTRSKLFHW